MKDIIIKAILRWSMRRLAGYLIKDPNITYADLDGLPVEDFSYNKKTNELTIIYCPGTVHDL